MKQLTRVCACLLWISCGLAAQSNPVPFINQPLVPASAAPGSGAFTLTVNGSGFAPTSVVTWNESARQTTVFSSTHLEASIQASDVANLGTARVAVVNVDSHNETSSIAFFPTRMPAPSVAFAQDPNFPVKGALGPLALGDFNNDAKLDVVNVYSTGGTTLEADVYLSKGNVQFQPPIKTIFGGYTGLIVGPTMVGDFNGDHNLDLLLFLSQNGSWQMTTLFGDGTGKFTLGPNLSIGSVVLPTAEAFPVADLDGDGNLDLVIVTGDSRYSSVQPLFGNGDGTFRFGAQIGLRVASGFGFPCLGDFNGDGLLDVAFFGYPQHLSIELNNGNRRFGRAEETVVAGSNLVTADLNGDGHLDLVTDNGAVLLNDGHGIMTVTSAGGEASGFPIAVGDFNGDGKLDLVFSGQNATTLLGNGDGTFQSAISSGFGLNGIVGLSDFNHDGRLDLVSSSGLFWQVPASLAPGSLAFGQQGVGSKSAPQTSTFMNVDSVPLTGVQITLNGADAQNFSQQNNCRSSIPVGGSCQIQIVFAPTSGGDKSALLSAAYKGLGSPQSVTLTGIGVANTSVSLLPASLHLGKQILNTTSASKTVTLTNTGTVDITISNTFTAQPFRRKGNCPSTLSPGQSCKIQITFLPTAIGQANGTLSVNDNAPDSPQTVALYGEGTLIALPIGMNFGSQKVGTSSSRVPVTLSNQGQTTLNISQINIAGADPSDFSQTNNCGHKLASGHDCTIQVTFTPTQTGTRSAQLQVKDDVNPSPQTVSLNGTGT